MPWIDTDKTDITTQKVLPTDPRQLAKAIAAWIACHDDHDLHLNTADGPSAQEEEPIPTTKDKEKVGTDQTHTTRKAKEKVLTIKAKVRHMKTKKEKEKDEITTTTQEKDDLKVADAGGTEPTTATPHPQRPNRANREKKNLQTTAPP